MAVIIVFVNCFRDVMNSNLMLCRLLFGIRSLDTFSVTSCHRLRPKGMGKTSPLEIVSNWVSTYHGIENCFLYVTSLVLFLGVLPQTPISRFGKLQLAKYNSCVLPHTNFFYELKLVWTPEHHFFLRIKTRVDSWTPTFRSGKLLLAK